jgi:hypothetical protein
MPAAVPITTQNQSWPKTPGRVIELPLRLVG